MWNKCKPCLIKVLIRSTSLALDTPRSTVKTVTTGVGNTATQWHYKHQEIPPKLKQRHGENWSWGLPRGHWRSCGNFWRVLVAPYMWQKCLIFFLCLSCGRWKPFAWCKQASRPGYILCGKLCYSLTRPRLKFWAIISKGMFHIKTTSAKEYHTHSEAWWWAAFTQPELGLWLGLRDSWISPAADFSCKTFRHLLESWRGVSPLSMTIPWCICSYSAKEWPHQKRITVLECSSQSPDLNPSENLGMT